MPPTPPKTLDLDALGRFSPALLLALTALLAGCQSTGGLETRAPERDLAVKLPRQPAPPASPQAAPQPPQDIWERMRLGFQLQGEIGVNPRIERQRLWFVGNPSFIENASSRGSLYIHYIVERLEERDMPLELALLPVIESAYNPFAYSRSDAVGLWQFIPSTGRYYNLRQTNWYDGRRDITASTNAALSYLSRLHDMFNGDWLLALAAYNAGEGTVSRAIERNQKLGLPTDYWNLSSLPQETQDYVPKLLALSQLVLSPVAYGVNLNPIANEPYFEVVECKQRLDLSRLAALANIEEDELYQLNPAYKKRITLDGPQHLLVPTQKAGLLVSSLSSIKPEDTMNWQQYRVRRGDSLDSIASRYRVPAATLRSLNDLRGTRLRVGQQLSIPVPSGTPQPLETSTAPRLLASGATLSKPTARAYQVRNGDSLWQIAKAHNVDAQDIRRWNKLSGNALKPGQTLRLQAPASGADGKATSVSVAKASAPAKPSAAREDVTYYKVKEGDSMYLIARRFNVEMQHLRNWNPRSGHALKPGQTLTLRLGSR